MCCCNEKKQKCQEPEILKSRPEDCSPEQISSCHGSVEVHPCVETAGCEHPERLQGKPGDCSLEQIRECHGDDKSHQCESRT
jgi:hypothetical protein